MRWQRKRYKFVLNRLISNGWTKRFGGKAAAEGRLFVL